MARQSNGKRTTSLTVINGAELAAQSAVMREREVPIRVTAEPRMAREFIDEHGIEWEVSEVDASKVPGARGRRCLIFESVHAIRRVWDYPPDWYRHTAAELSEISWHR
jgi:hypothetical protein